MFLRNGLAADIIPLIPFYTHTHTHTVAVVLHYIIIVFINFYLPFQEYMLSNPTGE